MDVEQLAQADVLRGAVADVMVSREQARLNRLRRLGFVLVLLTAYLWWRVLTGRPALPGLRLPIPPELLPGVLLIVLFGIVLGVPLVAAGRSPHVLYRPSEIDVSLSDVKGAGVVVDEVIKTLNLFLAHKTFRERMGGTPRRAILFEGPPGTGKTYMAKAMAREAGVPFLFVSSSAFQSMYYGQTNRKIRSYFRALRAFARKEGGAIGFIEEIDAIGASRGGMGSGHTREGIAGVVNELLIQLQSFDEPPAGRRLRGWVIDVINRW